MVFEIGLMIDVKLLIMDLRSSSPLKFPMEKNSTALERTVICQPIHSLGCIFFFKSEFRRCVSAIGFERFHQGF